MSYGRTVRSNVSTLLGVGLILFGGLTACGSIASTPPGSSAAKTYNFRMGSVAFPKDSVNLGAQKWADLLSQRTNGRITVQNINSGALGPEPQELTQLQSGAIDMFVGTAATVTASASEAGALLLPYAFPTLDAAHKYMDSADGQALMQQLNTHNLRVLAFGENGYLITFGQKAIATPADQKGLKIRVLPTFVDSAVEQALGATPLNVAYNQLYLGLSQHAVDAGTASLVSYASSNLTEVAKQVSLTNQELSPILFVMSPAAWNQLPPDLQKIVASAAHDAATYQRTETANQISAALAALPGKGVTVTKPDLAPFVAATKDLATSDLGSRIGTPWVNGVLKYATK